MDLTSLDMDAGGEVMEELATHVRITDRIDQANAITTFSGEPFHPLDPRVEEVRIEDIAHALANTVRSNGHCSVFYSVAQHSVLVAEWLDQHLPKGPRDARADVVRWGLMHDSAEAYLADLCAPVKRAIAGYTQLETNILEAIAQRFGLTWPMPAVVKHADLAVFKSEVDSGILRRGTWWRFPPTHPDAKLRIEPLTSPLARGAFLAKFNQLFANEPAWCAAARNEVL